MKITLKTQAYDNKLYELTPQPDALLFCAEGRGKEFVIPYEDIQDFQMTENRRDKLYFTMITGDVMFEGSISDRSEAGTFIRSLKKYWHGVINIEVRKK